MTFDPCRSVRPYFSDGLDGEPLPFAARFHLRVCPACRRMHRSLVATREALSALRDVDPEAGDLAGEAPEPDPK